MISNASRRECIGCASRLGSEDRKRVLEGLAEVRGRLGEPGAALRVAKMASELVP